MLRVTLGGIHHPLWGELSAPKHAARRELGANPWKGVSCMRKYELAYIADPELDTEGLEALEEKVKGWIKGAGGTAVNVDTWGKRRLAYPIKKRNDGFYMFVEIEMPPNAGAIIEQDLRLNEQILRYMITTL
jgi:small subunit ribosomal protein S6